MSYCRWSSNCYQCDVYVYESSEGVQIEVASSKYTSDIPRPTLANPAPAKEQVAYLLACSKWVKEARTEPLNLPNAGQGYCFSDWQDAINKLVELKVVGYNVPQYVIDELRQELESK